ncbi:MAG: hypothetical protein NT118_13575 [Lentisphaerae bacterium]|nr:hypothetical protein [Lentisphaerota bacterium]
MKKIYETSGEKALEYEAYWISPTGHVVPVELRHINTVAGNPVFFGMTEEEVDKAYQKNGEPPYCEGRARLEIMTKLISRGWVRVRYKKRNDLWFIEYNEFSDTFRKNIRNFLKGTLSGKYRVLSPDSYLSIKSIDDGPQMEGTIEEVLRGPLVASRRRK